MPIYAYKCAACGYAKDVLQKISDAPLAQCPECGADAFSKQVTAAGFQLKGSGWYVTDFRDNGKGGAKSGGSKDETKAEGKADAKAEGKADPAGEGAGAAKSSGDGAGSGGDGKAKGGADAPAAGSAAKPPASAAPSAS